VADWSTIETQLETWVGNTTGLDTHWAKRPRAMGFSDAGWCRLSIDARTTVGNDAIKFEYDVTAPAGARMRTYQRGARVFTFSVQVRTWLETVDVDAKNYTSLLRDRTGFPSAKELFDVAEIAFATILGEPTFDTTQDGREMSVAQLDMRFNAASNVEDTATTWIETVTDADMETPEGTVVWTGDLDVG